MKLLEKLLDAVYPGDIRCVGCGKEILPHYDTYSLCEECYLSIEVNNLKTCIRCGRGISREYSDICNNCLVEGHTFDGGVIPLTYEGMAKTLILRYKYEDQRFLAKYFAEIICDYDDAKDNILGKADCLVAVPVHFGRKRKRGFNQSQLLSEEISGLTGKKVVTDAVERSISTLRMKGLNRLERRVELENVFRAGKNIDETSKNIVIIDDIMTTGCTLSAVERVLRESGAEKVYVAAVAGKIG